MQSLILSIRIERRWPLLCALVIAAAWFAAAAFDIAARTPTDPSAAQIAAIAVAVLPPLLLAVVVWALLPGAERSVALAEVESRLEGARASVGDLHSRLEKVDAALASTGERANALAETASMALPGLGGSAAALEAAAARVIASGEATQRIADGFGAALPALARSIAEVDSTLRAVSGDSAVQLRAVEAMLAAVQARNREVATEADTTIAHMSGLLSKIDEASKQNTSMLSKRAYALDAAVDGVLQRTETAVDHIKEQLETQMRGIEAGVDSAGRQLTILGDNGVRLFSQRLDLLTQTSEKLNQEFGNHEAGSERLQALVAAQLEDLTSRLAKLSETSGATVDNIAARLGTVQEQLADLAAPLAASQAAVLGLDDKSSRLRHTLAEVDERLGAQLSATRQSMMGLESETQRLFDAVSGLGASVSEGSMLIGDAASALSAERKEIATLGAQLEGHFDTARAALSEIEAGAAAAAAEVAAGLGAEVARIAAAADNASDDMRAALAKVIDDTVAALGDAAGDRAETAFGAPVRAQIAAIEDASARASATGQDVAGRLAAQMLKLVETVGVVEARVGEVETRFAVRERDSLAARSVRIIEQLNGAAVDIARLMAITVGDAEWAAYLKGDQGVFARAVVPQLDRDAARKMSRLFQLDPEFRADATHFCSLFEGLIKRLVGDRDGEALAATMLSSDIGKIYIAIAEATDRLPPSRNAA